VLWRGLRQRGYADGYTILTDWLRPQREAARVAAVRRFERPPGEHAQADWGHVGDVEMNGQVRKLWVLTFSFAYSRMMMTKVAPEQKLATLMRMHEEAFRQLGGVPEEILYDRMKTVWQEIDERGEVVWNPVFLDFARYWGFTPRLCRPGHPLGWAQTKGKVESGVKYVRRNFLCGLQGQEPDSMEDLNNQLRQWVWNVANRRVHGTTHEPAMARWEAERLPYSYAGEELRQVARDAFLHWQGSRYSVPWIYAGKPVWVRQQAGRVQVRHGADCIADHPLARRKPLVVIESLRHARTLQHRPIATPEAKANLLYCSRNGYQRCNCNVLMILHIGLYCRLQNAAESIGETNGPVSHGLSAKSAPGIPTRPHAAGGNGQPSVCFVITGRKADNSIWPSTTPATQLLIAVVGSDRHDKPGGVGAISPQACSHESNPESVQLGTGTGDEDSVKAESSRTRRYCLAR